MSTLDRLREIVRAGHAGARAPRRELTYEPVDEDGQPLSTRSETPALAGATAHHTPLGPALVVERTFAADFAYGSHRVADFASMDAATLSLLTGRPVDVKAEANRRPIFLDLETTGLAGGAGTVAFLVGCGYFDGDAFRTCQFLLPGFPAERALLHAVGEFVSGTPFIVTFNGRTFDVPVMETRWLFHRMAHALEGVPHVDMLPPARRLWRMAGDGLERSCRLVALEQALFGVARRGDVPGWEIPQRYFSYVRHGAADALEPVLEHNRLDLLSLAAVTARAHRLVSGGAEATSDVMECLALGGVFARAGAGPRAEACYRRAADGADGDRATRELALRQLALLLRRSRRFGDAAEVWRRLLLLGHGRSPLAREALEALAIHHEHRERNLKTARALALGALRAEGDPSKREAVRYRLARLDRKLAPLTAPAGPVAEPLPLG